MVTCQWALSEPDMVSRAWLLRGLGHPPGVLVAVGGMVGGEKYRIAFVRPNGAVDTGRSTSANLGYALAGSGTVIEIGRLAGDVAAGRAAGKRWRQYLS